MPDRVSIDCQGGVLRVTLNRPEKRNALDLKMFQALVAAQKTVRATRGVRVVILEGAGQDFSSGLDVQSVLSSRADSLRLLWKWLPWRPNLAQQVCVGWRRLPVPVIAVIQGRCWGGGLQIALGADFRLAHPDSSLSVMEGKWGLIPDMGGTLALHELLARDQAMYLAMTAEVLSAQKACELGLVSGIDPDPAAAARELAALLMQRSPDALTGVKRLYGKTWNQKEGRVLAGETLHQLRILAGANQRIAVRRQQGDDVPFQD